MARSQRLQPGHRAIQTYYATLKTFSGQRVEHEGALETAFSRLLADTVKSHGWTLIPKLSLKVRGKSIAPDGTLLDDFNLRRGYGEAKDTHDKLDDEIRKKISKGYPLNNTIFEDTRQAVLYQNGHEVNRFDLTSPQQLADLLNDFYDWIEPDHERFDETLPSSRSGSPSSRRGWPTRSRRPTRTIRRSRRRSTSSSCCASKRSTRTSAATPSMKCWCSACSPSDCIEKVVQDYADPAKYARQGGPPMMASTTFLVKHVDGYEFGFDRGSLKKHGRFARLLYAEAQSRGFPWEFYRPE
jgi:hypothetical protein